MPTLVVPAFPFQPKIIDDQFKVDAELAKDFGWDILRFDFEALLEGHFSAFGKAFVQEGPALYRGWMPAPEKYKFLYDSLKDIGLILLTSPSQYETAHLLPNWYEQFRDITPETWFDPSEAEYPLIIKDYVKSAKHLWDTACYVENSDRLEEAVKAFREYRDDNLIGNIIARRFINLDDEVRSWWVKGELVSAGAHPDNPDTDAFDIPDELLNTISANLKTLDIRFCSVDIAKAANDFVVIEIGDGQVSDIAKSEDLEPIYKEIIKVQ